MREARYVGESLVYKGLLDPADLERARVQARDRGTPLSETLLSLGLVSEVALTAAMAEIAGLPLAGEIRVADIPEEVIRPVPIQFARRCRVLPLRDDGDAVLVAVADADASEALHDLRVLLGKPVRACVAPTSEILQAINRVYERGSERADDLMEGLAEQGLDALAHGLEEPKDLLEAADEAPIIRLVNGILFQALKDRASDIHVEPFERDLQVRYRIDGVLYPVLTPPKALQAPITSRIKVMAGLDIAEKRLPQDGRIRIKIGGKDIDIRVSVLPTAFGERVVMRLLDKSAVLLDLEQLG
ncbi:MAG: Flp pilus assembly complex ATPase component TadA, partial [Deltaproteobacteria bacterium]|nr:Flp pilus assembly complex ATPase component TadA [Deltaproteobacteria bacterium]